MKKIDREKGQHGANLVNFILGKVFYTDGKIQKGDTTYDKGVDFSFKFISPIKNIYFSEPIEVQVKTGPSYVRKIGNKWKLENVKKDELHKFQNTSSLAILVWVDPDTSEAYWTHIKKNSHVGHIYISKRATLSPITRYDLMIKHFRKGNKLNSLTGDHKRLIPPLNKGLREYAKDYYKSNLLGKEIPTLYGTVVISWNGWRKITRAGRKQENIHNSLTLLPILKPALENANMLAGFRRGKLTKKGDRKIETRYIFIESNIKGQNGAKHNIKITLKEIIDFPENWKEELNYYEKVKRVLIFHSIAAIKKKEALKYP